MDARFDGAKRDYLAVSHPFAGSTPNTVRGLGKRNLEGLQKVVISVW